MIFNLLLIFHFLSDFYLQNDTKVEMKANQKLLTLKFYKTEMFKHVLLYIIVSSLVFTLFVSNDVIDYLIVICAFLTHGVIDVIKIKLNKKYDGLKKQLFLLDQTIHILILYFVSEYIVNNFSILEWISIDNSYLLYILIILLLGRTANIIFGILFENYKPENQTIDDGHKNAGGLIGIMERILIFVFLVSGNIGSVGFIIAAKSVARFKKLSETQFGEYFLLGTLYSVLFTLLTYYIFIG
ncbi:hypothetical protein BK011_08050 [Tenericutes bacterium MZ-XQ]|nr:hypothetical protein BK011_08050 [Tenericutes bacterium MZ-XQ]